SSFCDTLQPTDEAFILTANGETAEGFLDFTLKPKLVQSFTNSRVLLKQALNDLRPRGPTMLYDAVLEGLRLITQGQNQKKALLIISDGFDDASTASEGQVVAAAEAAKVPVYTIGMGDPAKNSGIWNTVAVISQDHLNAGVLQTLSQRT